MVNVQPYTRPNHHRDDQVFKKTTAISSSALGWVVMVGYGDGWLLLPSLLVWSVFFISQAPLLSYFAMIRRRPQRGVK